MIAAFPPGRTALHWAAHRGHQPVVVLLLSAFAELGAGAANVDAADKKGAAARSRATAIRDNDMFGDSKKAAGPAPAKKAKTSIRPDHVRVRAERMKAGRMVTAGEPQLFSSMFHRCLSA